VTAKQSRASEFSSAAESSQLIEFERADVISPMIYPSRPTLVVSGRKPWANMTVSLVPRDYVRQPDYWAIGVVGTMPEIGQPAIIPYVVELELGDTIGTVGIEVVGANGTERIGLQAPDKPAKSDGAAEPAPGGAANPAETVEPSSGTGQSGTARPAEADRSS
jgi:hypothetical protein